MFQVQVLQKNKAKSALLIHGLFASAGFWLPSVRHFADHTIVLLNIDYNQYLAQSSAMDDLNEFLQQRRQLWSPCTHIIGHSFGAVVSALLSVVEGTRYHICPVFLADHVDLFNLEADLGSRIGLGSLDSLAIQWQLREAMKHARAIEIQSTASRGDQFLIPDADLFFRYRDNPEGVMRHVYHGDHYDVECAIKLIQKGLFCRRKAPKVF